MTDGAPRNSGVSSLLTDDMKNTTDRDLIISHWFLHHENSCAKLLRMANGCSTIKTNIEWSSSDSTFEPSFLKQVYAISKLPVCPCGVYENPPPPLPINF
jgi:hypothetical protein